MLINYLLKNGPEQEIATLFLSIIYYTYYTEK